MNNIDIFKAKVCMDLSKLYKMSKTWPDEEKKKFESWFWNVRPLFAVDFTQFEKSCRVYDDGEDTEETPKITSEEQVEADTKTK